MNALKIQPDRRFFNVQITKKYVIFQVFDSYKNWPSAIQTSTLGVPYYRISKTPRIAFVNELKTKKKQNSPTFNQQNRCTNIHRTWYIPIYTPKYKI